MSIFFHPIMVCLFSKQVPNLPIFKKCSEKRKVKNSAALFLYMYLNRKSFQETFTAYDIVNYFKVNIITLIGQSTSFMEIYDKHYAFSVPNLVESTCEIRKKEEYRFQKMKLILEEVLSTMSFEVPSNETFLLWVDIFDPKVATKLLQINEECKANPYLEYQLPAAVAIALYFKTRGERNMHGGSDYDCSYFEDQRNIYSFYTLDAEDTKKRFYHYVDEIYRTYNERVKEDVLEGGVLIRRSKRNKLYNKFNHIID